MARPKNKKKKRSKKNSQLMLRVKTFFISLTLGALAATGLWRCLDEDSGAVLKPYESGTVQQVDVGEGKEADPTIVNEQVLLAEESVEVETDAAEENEPEPVEEVEEPEESLEELFPMYAVAYHFHTQVRGAPEADARAVGYARRGAKFRVSERVSTKGCAKGWHEIAPGGTFLCDGAGFIVGDEPVDFSPAPLAPNLDASMPYDYVFTSAANIPQYWRIPNPEEKSQVVTLFEKLVARDAGEQAPEADGRLEVALENAAKVAEAAEAGEGEAKAEPEEPSEGSEAEATEETPAEVAENEADGGVADPYALPPFVYQRMKKGYFVSTDGKAHGESGSYVRTVRGRYVRSDKLIKAKPSTFEGFLTKGLKELPRAFNVGGGVKLLRQDVADGPLASDAKVARLTDFPFFGQITRRNKRYVQVGEQVFLSSRVAAVATTTEPPDDLKENERWIDIDLSEQVLVAYEGETPVFATLIASGKPGFSTPEGSFRIYSKHVSITMDDPEGGEEAYSIEDVPWTQYFKDSYALHAAFWHNRFGRVRSHGCINLSPADARRLFFWTGPHLPEGLHGIASTRENPGTRVVIHK